MNKVSVVVPVYNGENTIKNAVDSVLAQSYNDYRLVIINDGSTDTTAAIVDEYADKYPQIQCVHKKNGGQASARNEGIRLCQDSSYICFLDADDTFQKYALQRCVELMDNCEADFVLFGFNVYSGSVNMSEGRKLLRRPNPGNFYFHSGDSLNSFWPIWKLMSSPCNKMYRVEYIKSLFDERMVYSEDAVYNYLNFSKSTSVLCISDSLYNVHLGTIGSVNKRFVPGRIRDMLRSRQIEEEKMKEVFPREFDVTRFRQREVSTLAFMVYDCLYRMSRNDAEKEIKNFINSEYGMALLSHMRFVPSYYRLLLSMCVRGYWSVAFVMANGMCCLRKLVNKLY